MNDNIKNILEWILCFVVAVILALLIKYYLLTPTVVKSISMQPTLFEGQRLILDRTQRSFDKELKRGDIVTFEAPSDLKVDLEEASKGEIVAKYENEPQGVLSRFNYYVLEFSKTSFIKRVIGLPGDHVRIKDGIVYINEKALQEDYLQEGIITVAGNFDDFIVPEGSVFLMGDNRPDSTDCRRFGCIPLEKIESKVILRFWPLNVFGKIN